ncbi:MAG: SH3 domain-containing protein [Fibrobacter sp.]|nr:SH3 domain-containing protein [Fibrobacter sp.]
MTNKKTTDFAWRGYGKPGTFSIDSLNNNLNEVSLEKIAVLQRDNVCKLSFVFDGRTEKKIRQTEDSLLILFKGAYNATGKNRYDLPENLLFESVNLKEKTYNGTQWLGAAVKLGSKINVASFSTSTLSGQSLILYMKTENRNISLWTSDKGSEWEYPFYEGQQYSVNMDSLSMKAQLDVKKAMEPDELFAVNGDQQLLNLKSVKREEPDHVVQENMKTLIAEDISEVKPKPAPVIDKQYLFASKDFINVRSGPSMDSDVVDQLKTGNKLEVIQKQGVWVNVVYNSKKGWVHNSLLVSNNAVASAEAEKKPEIPLVNEPGDNVRKVSLQLPEKTEPEEEYKIKYRGSGRDPFVPLINDTISESGMPLIENLRLVGILFGNDEKIALLEDLKTNNRPFALREEDKVDNGKLLKIYKNKIVFLITEFGISRSLTMNLSSSSDREARK